jgi:hypothetical protein
MKKLVLIFLVFRSVITLAQNVGLKTSEIVSENLIVVDGKVFNKGAAALPVDSILIVYTISKEKAVDVFPHLNSKRGVTVIVTKNGAIKSYQEKLRLFSDDYGIYLNVYGSYDGDIYYDIDGKHRLGDDMLTALYNLPAKLIKDVVFIKDYMDKGRNVKVVTIHTKNN